MIDSTTLADSVEISGCYGLNLYLNPIVHRLDTGIIHLLFASKYLSHARGSHPGVAFLFVIADLTLQETERSVIACLCSLRLLGQRIFKLSHCVILIVEQLGAAVRVFHDPESAITAGNLSHEIAGLLRGSVLLGHGFLVYGLMVYELTEWTAGCP